MEVVIVPDSATIGALAADAVVALLARKPTAVLGLATGSSPLVVYAELIRRYRRRRGELRAEPRASCSTSTSGCRPSTRSATGR